jgi:hypothetical protein
MLSDVKRIYLEAGKIEFARWNKLSGGFFAWGGFFFARLFFGGRPAPFPVAALFLKGHPPFGERF